MSPAPRLVGDIGGTNARFEHKGRFGDDLARIPTCVIRTPYGALLGAVRALERQ